MVWLPLLLSCLFSHVSALFGSDVIVETTHGHVLGSTNGQVNSFRSIPYALPPIGPYRWQAPVPRSPWRPTVLDVTDEAPSCPQTHCADLTPASICPKNFSEDCLYLSIFTPSKTTEFSNLTVMVFIHGGNFFDMSGTSPLYDGEVFVQKGNVILVNINYRLGALGFLVTGKGKDDATGNYGLYDQVMAMSWIKQNIKFFGGDPNKITLFGQSAGAQSVVQHMTSTQSSALFRYAIIESVPLPLPYKSYEEAFILGSLLAEAAGCPISDLQCLRKKSADDIVKAAYTTTSEVASLKLLEFFEPYGPSIDGTYVKGQPLDIYHKGEFDSKPLMIGTTTEETVVHIYGAFNASVSLSEYLLFALAMRPDNFIKIIEKYPPSSTSQDQREVMVTATTDDIFVCSSRNLARTFLNKGQPNVWVYHWNHTFSFPGWGNITFCKGRVCHGSELVYVFATAYKGNFTFTPEEVTLSDDVIAYWTNFAKTGDPNNSGENDVEPDVLQFGEDGISSQYKQDPFKRSGEIKRLGLSQVTFRRRTNEQQQFDNRRFRSLSTWKSSFRKGKTAPMNWPKYSKDGGWSAMSFQTPTSHVVKNYRAEMCDFWDSIGY